MKRALILFLLTFFSAPTNAADAPSVMSGKVAYSHFVFRYDFKDWKLMMDFLAVGEELMPHRDISNIGSRSQGKPAAANANDCQAPLQHLATVKNLSVVVGDSSGIGDANSGIRRCKRKLEFLSVLRLAVNIYVLDYDL
ncbi:hypothetical protein CsSME_00047661 [Camellia sinensis var. sinensis]